jgi:hypothetical protein
MSPNNSLTIVYDVVATTCSRKNRIIAIMFQRENCLDSKNQLANHSIIIYIYIYIKQLACFFNVPWYAGFIFFICCFWILVQESHLLLLSKDFFFFEALLLNFSYIIIDELCKILYFFNLILKFFFDDLVITKD